MTTHTFIVATAVILVFALALYLGQAWPLKALAWADNAVPAIIAGSKVLVKGVVVLGTASGLLWAGFAARKK